MQLLEKFISFFVLSSNAATERKIVVKRLIITKSGTIYISGFKMEEKPTGRNNKTVSLFN